MAQDHFDVSLTLEASASEVAAGAALTLRARASCPDAFELSGETVAFFDADGNEIGTASLEESAEAGFVTAEIPAAVPDTLGTYRFGCAIEPAEGDGASHAGATAEAVVEIVAHTVYLNIWDVPSAVAVGEDFTFHVGAKCSCGCDLGQRALVLRDGNGHPLTRPRLRKAVWPGTGALYFAPLKATAPSEIGATEWTVEFVASRRDQLHAPTTANIAIRTISPPEHRVTVHVVDDATGAALEGIVVMLHPHRAVTDRKGVARIAVAGPLHRLHVSGRKYVPYQGNIDASGDASLRVRLAIERSNSPFHPPIHKQEPSTMEVL